MSFPGGNAVKTSVKAYIEDPAASCRESSTVRNMAHFIYAR